MAEYKKTECNLLSRIITNSKEKNMQLKAFSDNRQKKFVLQLWDNTKGIKDQFEDSIFQSLDKKNTYIYMIYDKNSPGEPVEYIGKTFQPTETRFKQHCQVGRFNDIVPGIDPLVHGNWTPFETATHEQYWIGEAGKLEVLKNRINALDKIKWNYFKSPVHLVNMNQERSLTENHF